MLADRVVGQYFEFAATGYVSADEAATTFQAIRDDANVPDGLPWLMDLRHYDQNSMSPDELQPRVLRMFALLGPKL